MFGLYAAAAAIAIGVSVSVALAATRNLDCRTVDAYTACFNRSTGLTTLSSGGRQLGSGYLARNDFEDLDWAGMAGPQLRAVFPGAL